MVLPALLCLTGSLAADSGSPLVVLEANRPVYHLGPRMEILEDPGRKLELKDILSGRHDGKFTRTKKKRLGLKAKSAWWIRVRLRNPGPETRDMWLVSRFVWLRQIDLFEKNSGDWTRRTGGTLQPFGAREVKDRYVVFPLRLPAANEKVVYLRVESIAIKLVLQLHRPEHFLKDSRDESILNWMFFGIVLVMLAYNAFLGLSLRDVSYLYYVLYSFFLGLYVFINQGYAFEYLWPEYPLWNIRSDIVCSGFLTVFLILFARSFLRLRDHAPRMDKTALVYMGLAAAANLWFIVSAKPLPLRISNYLYLAMPFLLITAGVFAWRAGFRPARFYLLGYSIFSVAVILQILNALNLLPQKGILISSLQIGASIELALFSAALSDRLNAYRRQQEAAEEQLRSEKTRIAGELHDTIGSRIARVIFTLRKRAEPDEGLADQMRVILRQLRDIVFLTTMNQSVREELEKEMEEYLRHLRVLKSVRLRTKLEKLGRELQPAAALHILRIFTEWMANTLKHQKPELVDIRWVKNEDTRGAIYTLYIRSSVAGKPGFSWSGRSSAGGAGLKNIAERGAAIGARIRSFGFRDATVFVCRMRGG